MKSILIALALVAALGASTQATAMGRLVDLRVVDRTTQQELPVYRHEGRYYIAGQPGHRYQLQLRSRECERVLGVLSVDGVNVLSGDTADWSQTGYVLDAYAATEIRGWRKSLSEVADFVFADASQSYASRTGRPDNVGVIGMAVFRQRPLPRRVLPIAPQVAEPAQDAMLGGLARSAPAPKAKAAESGGPLGTGHGPREASPVTYTDFTRASSTPDEVVTLYYDTRESLLAQGVIPSPRSPQSELPDPFPGHFVPDPR
ncbi:hypothetical protein ACXU4B_16880 [Dyella soli]|uniref:Uncharacterized protein n=1 Tax=Dyella soli TaxID=522319 RepID=A0A4R0YM50_9GAMM|nr:hypothetical protein [Dyella soli]TCI06521.1 hypothetical protein EZM97_34140 [Dyella soli]